MSFFSDLTLFIDERRIIEDKNFLRVETENNAEFKKIIETASKHKFPFKIMGSGLSLENIKSGSLLIKNNCRSFNLRTVSGKIKGNDILVKEFFLFAASGAILNQVVRFTLDEGLAGMEELLGVPGTIGGFLKKCFVSLPADLAKTFYQVTFFVPFFGETTVAAEDRKSMLDKIENNGIILSVVWRLEKGDRKLLWQKAMQKAKQRV